MIPRAFVVALSLLLATATAAQAQDGDFERALERARASWGRGDADALAALAVRGGLVISIGRRSFGPLGSRHAAALLRDVFDRLGTAALREKSVQMVGGGRPRGYGEFVWVTDGARTATVFLGLVREPEGWRLMEIRISVPGW